MLLGFHARIIAAVDKGTPGQASEARRSVAMYSMLIASVLLSPALVLAVIARAVDTASRGDLFVVVPVSVVVYALAIEMGLFLVFDAAERQASAELAIAAAEAKLRRPGENGEARMASAAHPCRVPGRVGAGECAPLDQTRSRPG
ncbi:hypothetical protein DMB38_29870 [Streptomyces sp. WAC 06738]|uniref:hypothetical protein n=1 Tax=Streptomyces sp. WAC 06738 TaxID=2203210 RepID=UPI000F6F8C95|nr:hypothetical protein [Streptomyces sp. WAC 06738]AZM49428.1 hypothetical protein DMB38_29870 [Streptomyces sp. WAC 06738]